TKQIQSVSAVSNPLLRLRPRLKTPASSTRTVLTVGKCASTQLAVPSGQSESTTVTDELCCATSLGRLNFNCSNLALHGTTNVTSASELFIVPSQSGEQRMALGEGLGKKSLSWPGNDHKLGMLPHCERTKRTKSTC